MEQKTITNKDIMNCLMNFKKEVSADIKNAKEETNRTINLRMGNVEKNIEDIKDNVKDVDKKVIDVIEAKKESRVRMERMEKRLLKLEEETAKSLKIRDKTNKLREMQKTLQAQPTGRTDLTNQPAISKNDQTKGNPEENLWNSGSSYKSNWARQLNENLTKDAESGENPKESEEQWHRP